MSTYIDIVTSGDQQYIDIIYQNIVNVVYAAPQPITNDSDVGLSNDELNFLYPTALFQQLILLPNLPLKYFKLDSDPNGVWELQPYNPLVS